LNNTNENGLKAGELINLLGAIEVIQDGIVSKTLKKSPALNLTLFAFDANQGLSGHSSPMDAFVQILSGKMKVTIAGEIQVLEAGEFILMPAGIDHALDAVEPAKMLLTMVSAKS